MCRCRQSGMKAKRKSLSTPLLACASLSCNLFHQRISKYIPQIVPFSACPFPRSNTTLSHGRPLRRRHGGGPRVSFGREGIYTTRSQVPTVTGGLKLTNTTILLPVCSVSFLVYIKTSAPLPVDHQYLPGIRVYEQSLVSDCNPLPSLDLFIPTPSQKSPDQVPPPAPLMAQKAKSRLPGSAAL